MCKLSTQEMAAGAGIEGRFACILGKERKRGERGVKTQIRMYIGHYKKKLGIESSIDTRQMKTVSPKERRASQKPQTKWAPKWKVESSVTQNQ